MAIAELGQLRKEPILARILRTKWRFGSTILVIASLILLAWVSLFDVGQPAITVAILAALLGSITTFVLALSRTSRELHRKQQQTGSALQDTSHDLRQMADNIQEIFWAIDARTKKALFVNPAYETVTGRSCQSLRDDPSSYEEVIHPEDRVHVLAKLEQATSSGHFDERFRITRPDGGVRWVWVRAFPVRDSEGKITRLVGTALDVTAQKRAEDQVATNLEMAKSAWAEEEALRKATLSLTQDLHMDNVMATLLRSLAEVVPYTCARVMVPEGGPHWLALGERVVQEPEDKSRKPPLTLIDDQVPIVRRVAEAKQSVLIPDTAKEEAWQLFKGHKHLRSWLSVPLISSGEYLGFLSVGHAEPNRFNQEHVRRTELLAIPASAAIENARLYTRATIFAEELERRVKDLNAAEDALLQAQADRKISEDRFQTVFHSNPVPFSITTYREGRFVDVNIAFEHRYGYSRTELLGRTAQEIRIWEDPSERVSMIAQLQRGAPIRNMVTRLRTKSGQIKLSAYSADKIQFDGQECILVASDDVLQHDLRKAN
jgi:PAS domain S-box-containing protein